MQIRIVRIFLYIFIDPDQSLQNKLMTNPNLVEIDLREKQVYELLKLQQLFHSHYLTEELLNGMISLYVKFVENIHHNQHPMRIFFMEKIKFVLSRPEIIKILQKKCVKQNTNMRQTIRGIVGMNSEEELELKRMAQETKQEIRQNHFINLKKERNYDKTEKGQQLREKEINMKIQMQVQIMQEVQQNMLKMKQTFIKQGQANKNKVNEINKIIQKQDMALNQRLAKRKKKLRKKSVDSKDKEVIQTEQQPPIPKQQLLQMKKQLNQTYERFTRLTMNKGKRETQGVKQNEGRVKIKVHQAPIQQEDIFDQIQKEKAAKVQQPKFFKKKTIPNQDTALKNQVNQGTQKQEVKVEQMVRDSDSSIEYKAFDQKKGRVTVRQKNYQQIQEEQLF